MNQHIEKINDATAALKVKIINHEVYAKINDLQDLRIFMEHHIFAVWDFMSLLKALQINLTCTTLPWFPVGNPKTRQLINEIVAGEEADFDDKGATKSHFELYLDAMNQVGADTSSIQQFISALQAGNSFSDAYEMANVPFAARNFINSTFKVINQGKAHTQAASFTFGREDLIPGMFHSIVNDFNSDSPEKVSTFKYYLDRHIEVDGDTHSHLALDMTAELCHNNQTYWNEALIAVEETLAQRIALWDAALREIKLSKELV